MIFEVVQLDGSSVIRRHRSLKAAIQSWREFGEEDHTIILRDKGSIYRLARIEGGRAIFNMEQEAPLVL